MFCRKFLAECNRERIVKIGQYLAKLQVNIIVNVFDLHAYILAISELAAD